MKKKFLIILILITTLFITACESKSTSDTGDKERKVLIVQEITDIEKDENGEITKGTLEGYTFKETEEVTNRVKIQMETGEVILMVLSNKDTPITIENFKNLVKDKFYDGIIWHRVINRFMIQCGDPTGTGFEGSGTEIKGEFSSNGVKNSLSHVRGVVSMARSNDPNSASSQFFIVQDESTYLDGNYAAFGKVFAGMDVVDAIASVETDSNDKPLEEIKIKSIRFIEVE